MNRMTTAQTSPATAHTYWTMGRGDSERAFRAARRHSRVIRILRVAIPLAVALGFTGVFLVTYLNPLRMLTKLPINLGNLVVSGTEITMEKPISPASRATRALMRFPPTPRNRT
jgi:lipopolysaccharide export system protein LptC